MKILVTGGAGFIGSNLAQALLAEGHAVRILDNFSTGDPRNLEGLEGDLEVQVGDITCAADCARACEGVDAVSHQAALGSVPRSMLEPELYSFNNLHGFVTLCNQARLAGIQRIVYASSSAVYGDLEVSPKTEAMRGQALSPYAASKQGNEDFATAFHAAYGTTFMGFRYFNVFGPRQDPRGAYAAVIPLFITALGRGESPVIFGDGGQCRDFVHVGNVVRANMRALMDPLPPGAHVLNVGCGESTTVNELFSEIAQAMESGIQAIHGPDRSGDIRDSLSDMTRARQVLDLDPWIGLREGLRATVDWYRRNPDRLV